MIFFKSLYNFKQKTSYTYSEIINLDTHIPDSKFDSIKKKLHNKNAEKL